MPTLNWLDRELAVKAADAVPFRVLDFDPKLSVGDPAAENLIIQDDNLDAVKAVIPYFAGRVKCFAIDGPYNTRSAFEHYDDNLEHSTWLSMMYPRLELMRDLLAEDGSIWVCIDDNEAHYLKVIMDEVFGRKNFVANVVWQSKDTPGNNSAEIAETHNHVLAYRKSDAFAPHLLERNERQLANYTNLDDDHRGSWLGADGQRLGQQRLFPRLRHFGTNPVPPTAACSRRGDAVDLQFLPQGRAASPSPPLRT